MSTLKTTVISSSLYFYYSLLAIARQAQYGIQILVMPLLALSVFMAVYASTRMMGGDVKNLFYPFLVYNLINFPLGAVTQISFGTFTNTSYSSVLLATPTSINTLLGRFLGDSWTSLIGNLFGVLIAGVIVKPAFHGPTGAAASLLLLLLIVPSIQLGMAIGMKFIFAHQLSQFILLGFFAILVLPTDVPWLWIALPFTASLHLFAGASPVFLPFLYGLIGVILWWIIAKITLLRAYNHYRSGQGVDRR
jgi:hypothetical protein